MVQNLLGSKHQSGFEEERRLKSASHGAWREALTQEQVSGISIGTMRGNQYQEHERGISIRGKTGESASEESEGNQYQEQVRGISIRCT
jgi:hypothetical protein